jgi:micrococcal nuclease
VAIVLLAAMVAGCAGVTPTATDGPSPSTAIAPTPTGSATSTAHADGSGDVSAEAEVVDVIDGDTLEVRVGGAVERVRLIGINTPETGECFADRATDALADLVAGREVRLEQDVSDRDQYGRILAYVMADGEHVNAALVRGGFAIAREYPPDTARADELAAAQEEAQRAGAGMWGPDGCASDVDASGIALSVQADAPGDDNANLNGEWLDIRNTGEEALDLSGWTVKDESASHRYTFADDTTVAAGASLRLHTGCGQDTTTERYWCRTDSAVWNNGGDTAFLLDPDGRTVTSRSY